MPNAWDALKLARHGDTCIVIGNGPSLNRVPREFLYKYDTFGTNRIYLKFTPEWYVAVNPLVIQQNLPDIQALESSAKFIGAGLAQHVPGSFRLVSTGAQFFSTAPYKCIWEGYTVTYVALQLAYFMGYRTALLVGVDHRYTFQGRPNEEKLLEGADPNHFDAGYFQGMKWNNPDLEKSEFAYKLARAAYEADGRRIMNLGPDSALEVFEKGEIAEWM